MLTPRNQTIAETIYTDIDKNEYLLELYSELLRAYTRKLFNRSTPVFDDKKQSDLLRFADILSKSTCPNKAGMHKVWSQQIIALLDKLYPNDYKIGFYKYSILTACNNFQGIKHSKFTYSNTSVFDELVEVSDKEYFRVPNSTTDYFFEDQKSIFDGFSYQYFSYSAPTSLGKSYVMRVFIKENIIKGSTCNFAIIVPTKALINEIRSKILADLGKDLMQARNYKVVTSSSDIMLEQDHNFIFIMTPERFLYLMNTTGHKVEYLFIDEAHKISTKDTRSPFYYELVDKISELEPKPHIIFSSPNIPNPEEYLRLVPDDECKNNKRSTYAPVCQMKYLIDLKDGVVKAYNDYSRQFIKMGNASSRLNLTSLIHHVINPDEQNIVYCSSLRETMDQAVEFARSISPVTDPEKKKELEAISKSIKNEINADYFLVDLIKKGIAFHVGYLPANIRLRIEEAFKNHVITTLFCTSTLIEGVNLPADNLFITSYKNGIHKLDNVSFRNLIGRVGRIDHSLFGNVFMVCLPTSDDSTIDRYEELLTKEIPDQKLSIESSLTRPQKEAIITGLVNNDFEMRTKNQHTTADEFTFMRKEALVFINDLRAGKESLIVRQLREIATPEQMDIIIQNIQQIPPSKSIDVSPDQFRNLHRFVESGEVYPPLNAAGEVEYNDVVVFLEKLAKVFKWRIYEKKHLGYHDSQTLALTHIKWYANILYKWMSGYGLSYIIQDSIRYKEQHPDTGIWANNWKIEDYYNRHDPKHKNLVIADTLNTIENIILFSVANYFREFSTEYKKQHGNTPFDNDWYEYVEFGTTNALTIILQRYGFSREASSYIIRHATDFVDYSHATETAPFVLIKNKLLTCNDDSTKTETPDIYTNVPELFI